MPRIRTVDIDAYDQAEVLAALNLLVSLTDDIAGIMRHMTPARRKQLWKHNAKTITLGQKLRVIDANLQDMETR